MQVGHALDVDAPVQAAVAVAANAGTLCQGAGDPAAGNACAVDELESLHAGGLPFGWPDTCTVGSPHRAACWEWADGGTRHRWDFPLRNAGTKPASTA